MSIGLGTLYGDVRLRLDGLQGDANSADDIFTTLKDGIVNLFSSLELPSLAPQLDGMAADAQDALDQVSVAAEDAFATIPVAAEDAAAAAADAMSAGGATMADAAATSTEETGSVWADLASQIQEYAAQIASAASSVGESMSVMSEGAMGAAAGMGGMFDMMPEGLARIGALGGSMLEFEAIAGTTEAVGKFTGSLIGMNSEMESLHQQLTSITGSSGSADKILAWVKQFGQNVPDTTEHLAQATVAVQALGLNAQQVMPYIANVAAAMGTDLPTAARAFIDANEGRWMMLQNVLHVSKAQLEEYGLKLDKHGKVVAGTLVPAFEKLSKTKFGNALANQMDTMKGKLSNLTDRVQFFAMNMGKPLFDMAKSGLGNLFGWLDSHKKDVDAFASSVGTGLVAGFKTVGDVLGQVFPIIVWVAQQFGSALGPGFKAVGDALGGLGKVFKGIAWGDVLAPLGNLAKQVGTLGGTALKLLATAFKNIPWLAIGLAIGNVAGWLATAFGWINQFISFLQTHEAAMVGFKAALAAIAVVIAIPLVTAFIAWAAGAAAAAIATIAATWPILLIIAAIALLAIGIYELIKHWGDIQKFFGNVGKAIGAFFSMVGTWVHVHLEQIKLTFEVKLHELGKLIHAAWDFIVQLFMTPINQIVGLFEWLYDHNTYFQELVDKIREIIKDGLALIEKLWQGEVKFLTDTWDTIKKGAQVAWKAIHDHVIKPVQDAWAWITSTVGGWAKWLGGKWDEIVKGVTTWWDGITGGVKSGAKTAMDGLNTTFIKPIQDAIGNLISQALTWGTKLMQMFIQGVTGQASALKNAATGALGGLAKVLGFHSPAEEGPGADADTWAPNLMRMYAGGIEAHSGLVTSAATGVASGMRLALIGGVPNANLNIASATGAAPGGLGVMGGAGSSGQVVNHNETLNLTLEMEDDGAGDDGAGDDSADQATQFGQSAGTALLQSLTQRGY